MCKYVCRKWSFKYKLQYENNFIGHCSLIDTPYSFAKENHDLTIQLSITMTMTMYRNISKIADQSRPVNSRMHYMLLPVTSSGCLKLNHNP